MNKFVPYLIVILLSSCSQGSKNDGTVIDLSKNSSTESVNPDFLLNDIAENISYVQLKNDDSLFHSELFLHSVSDCGDYCFSDNGNNDALSVYDKEGKLLSHFNRKGRGEGEFLGVNSLLFNGNDRIEVLSSDNNSLYQYNRKGEFQRKITVGRLTSISSVGNDKYLSLRRIEKHEAEADCARIIDAQGNVYARFLTLDSSEIKSTIYIHTTVPMVRCKNGYNFPITLYQGDISYNNYDIEKNQFSEICKFDLGRYRFSADEMKNGRLIDDFILMVTPVKVENYLFVQYHFNKKLMIGIWDLRTSKLISRVDGELSHRLPNGEILKRNYLNIFAHNDQLILTCNPSVLAGKINEPIDPEGNDVIVTLKFKQ